MKKNKTTFLVVIIVLVCIALFVKYKCLFRFFFGIPCPFCGMTRALYHAFILDFRMAFHYHMFWPVIIIIVILHVLSEFKFIKLNKNWSVFYLICFGMVNLVYYFYRLFNNSDILQISIQDSLMYKIYSFIVGFF